MNQKPKALLMTYAPPEAENRLKPQLKVLLEMDFEVHTLGLGSATLPGVAKHFELKNRTDLFGLIFKGLLHIFLSPQRRFSPLRSEPNLVAELGQIDYRLVITHDLELLPLLTQEPFKSELFVGSIKHVDLHELHEFVSPTSGVLDIFWKALNFRLRPYHDWLIQQLKSAEIALFTLVNASIGEWYVSKGLIKDYVEVRNCAPYRSADFSTRESEGLQYIYHGKYGASRGLEKLIKASLSMRPIDTLNFMLTGNVAEIGKFREASTALNASLVFHEAVPMNRVSEKLASFDVEVIFFEPVTKNLLYTLPNKFFEAVQARLAILTGPSPELVRHVSEYGNGVFSRSFSLSDLEALLTSLERSKVEELRFQSHKAAETLNSESESKALAAAWKELL